MLDLRQRATPFSTAHKAENIEQFQFSEIIPCILTNDSATIIIQIELMMAMHLKSDRYGTDNEIVVSVFYNTIQTKRIGNEINKEPDTAENCPKDK